MQCCCWQCSHAHQVLTNPPPPTTTPPPNALDSLGIIVTNFLLCVQHLTSFHVVLLTSLAAFNTTICPFHHQVALLSLVTSLSLSLVNHNYLALLTTPTLLSFPLNNLNALVIATINALGCYCCYLQVEEDVKLNIQKI